MSRPVGTLTLGLAVLAVLACGRKGPPVLPPGRGPAAVENLRALQRGPRVVLEWDRPARDVSGRPLAGASFEVRALEAPTVSALSALRTAEIEKRAEPLGRIEDGGDRIPGPGRGSETGRMRYEHAFDGTRAGSLSLAFLVRVVDRVGRRSDFCPAVMVETKACPGPPKMGEGRVRPDSIEISWAPPEGNIDGTCPAAVGGYAVYRAEGEGRAERRTQVPVAGLVFEDRDFRFGSSYIYTVRALAPGAADGVESEDSDPVVLEPEDVFAPAAPSGLVAVAGPELVSLSWSPVREPDLAGYRVWRRTEGEDGFSPLPPALVRETSYTDVSARKGKTYVYAVSACDLRGNESRRSESGPLTLKGNRP